MAKIVDIPDLNLRAVIENALGKTSGDTITGSDMASLTELFAPNANISNLTGLEGATNLRKLHLGTEYLEEERYINSNSVSDLSPLTGLTNLTGLWLDGNNITDISAVEGLINLTRLELDGNNITDLSPLVENTELKWVYVNENPLNSLSINTHIPVLQSRRVRVIVRVDDLTRVDIPDPNLRIVIEIRLGKASDDRIIGSDM